VSETYTLELWAGAGQCDTSNVEKLVGTVTVVIVTDEAGVGTATVSYNVTAVGWTLGTTHVYVGNDPIPTKKNGKLTVAPGALVDGAGIAIPIDCGTGTIFVLAHAEVEFCDEGS
jgi:hypothetical protein